MNQILFGNWSSERWKLIIRQTFEKGNMTGDIKATRDRIVTAVAFLSKTVTQKDTQDRSGTECGPIFTGNEDKTSRPKDMQEGIIRRLGIQSLIRGLTGE